MYSSNFSKQFKQHYHTTLAAIYAERYADGRFINRTERKIVVMGLRYHKRMAAQLQQESSAASAINNNAGAIQLKTIHQRVS